MKHVISGLIKKRARLAGEITHRHRELVEMEAELSNIDGVLKAYGYDTATIQDVGVYNRMFKMKELGRLIRQIGRERPELADNVDIAREIIARKEWDVDSAFLLSVVRTRVKDARKYYRRRGLSA